MTRLPGLVLAAQLAYGGVVPCGSPGWIGTPHRATNVVEYAASWELQCPHGVGVYGERFEEVR